jgi:predicted transcriptional regulator
MPGPELTETLQVRMRPEEKEALSRLATHYERTPSEMVRRFIRRETRRLERQRKVKQDGSEESKKR